MENMSYADWVRRIRDQATERRAALDGELRLLWKVIEAINSGLAISVNDQTPEPMRQVFAAYGGAPTAERVAKRIDQIDQMLATIDIAFKVSKGYTHFDYLLNVAHVLDGGDPTKARDSDPPVAPAAEPGRRCLDDY